MPKQPKFGIYVLNHLEMENWILFWKCLLIAGIGAYLITVVLIIPFGARDIFDLLRALGKKDI